METPKVYLEHTDHTVGEPLTVRYNNYGGAPCAIHNMPCPVCMQEVAIIQLTGKFPTFQPCRFCGAKGWVTIRTSKLSKRVLRWFGLVKPWD